MFSLHDETLCSRKRDQMKVYDYEESFRGSFKRTKQEDQTQTKIEKNTTTLFYQRSKSENNRLIKPEVKFHLDEKVQSEPFDVHRSYLKEPVSVEQPKMSLDLELNLSSSSNFPVKTITKKDECSKGGNLIMIPSKKGKSGDIGLRRSPSWLAFEGEEKQEMVTTVCMKCHMLVMLCKSTLVCPNCKFMHPDDQSSTKQFKPSSLFKLLC